MDALISAVASDLISRFISFLLQRSQHQVHRAAANSTPRLQRLLLRARTVVEEADGRRIANHSMLVQLKQLRDSMYRGFYMLDTSGACLPRPNGGGVEASRRQHELQAQIMDDLEAVLDDMKEFLLLLTQCPPVARQPYSAYLFMERCMFGRRMEKEHIVSFLLNPCSSLDVLPVTGPFYIGKSTLVEHACREEAVRGSFPNILRLSSDDLNDLAAGSGSAMDDHQLGPSHGRSLMIVELAQDTDLAAWGKLQQSLRHRADGTKAILISRMDRVSSLGTVQALRLTRLRREEYWYFFRVLAFGSADPYDHHPSLVPIAERIAAEIDGASFMMTGAVTRALRADLSPQFWGRALGYVRRSMRMHARVFGEDPRAAAQSGSGERYLSYIHGLKRDCPPILCYRRYKTRSLQGDTASMVMTTGDVFAAARSVRCGDKFDFVTQSHIPPYYYYVSKWVVEKRKVHRGNKCPKRKRN